ncbi:reticulon-2 isoform X2 [Eublepharis macularius]|uniref:Reticulon n=1 Tax=Eublepharis macularius TaxID=481883 RepID=A0AA97LL14_EUBMA|nr:reticulon-2 isoform X2 [Eublepharis macularius]
MGQVLGFAHCKESPSTASTTPDSTEGGPNSSPTLGEHGSRGRRDSQTRRTRSQLPRTETCETFVPALGDSLENIPSICPSPEGEGVSPTGHGQGLDPFSGWDVHPGDSNEAAILAGGGGVDLCPPHSPTVKATEGEQDSAASSDTSPEDLSPPDALMPQPAEGASCGASTIQHQTLTLLELCQRLVLEEDKEEEEEEEAAAEEEEEVGQESVTEEKQAEPDQSEKALETVADLVYWRDTRKSTFVFTSLMVALLCLLHFSIVSVVSYVSLAVLAVTISLRVYSKVLHVIHRGEGANPFQAQMDADLGLSKEQLERLTERVVFYTTSGTRSIQRLFLVEDLVESIKFAFLFYILTYVGAVFNGMTLLILGVICAFTFPLLYRQHQAQIDQYVGLVRNQLSNLRAKMLAKLPTAKAKAE